MKEFLLLCAMVALIVLLTGYMGFYLGVKYDRNSLARVYTHAIEQTYDDGYNDGVAATEFHYRVSKDL
jgi:hypothetical protein